MDADPQPGSRASQVDSRPGQAAAWGPPSGVDGDVLAQLGKAGFADAVQVGRGGFGVVYRCVQVGLSRVVAVKVLTMNLAENRARFLREQEAMARLTGHPNIVSVLQVGETEHGYPFLVMPYCAQGCWQARITRLGRLGLDEVLRVGVKIAGALESAHRVGVVHRDVKPANILLTDYGESALCDFGIARTAGGGYRTATGLFAGSPAYTPPETINGDPPSPASDVYGLAASLLTGLTGHAAFALRPGEQVVAQLLRIATEPVPDVRQVGVPDAVATIIEQAMARTPADRPSALEMGQSIQEAQHRLGLPVCDIAVPGARQAPQPERPVAAGHAPTASKVPVLATGMVGRDSDAARLRELMSGWRLVTLAGIGGVGKTTLATRAAHEVRGEFVDGLWWVELADLRDGTLLVEFVAAALGVRDGGGRALTEVLTDFLGERRALIVLDNCEHLIDEVGKLVDALLRHCPRLQILATSREVLGVSGESVLKLSPLAVPDVDANPTLGSLSEFAGVALFLQRASAAVQNFTLTRQNADAVAQICAHLDGLPLALELAAARLRAMSVDQIAAGLSDRYRLLTRGRRGAPSRQQTLSGCVGWSYDLCTAAEQQLWARLSVFAGTFDLDAASSVCAGDLTTDDCCEILSDLVDKSILVRVEHDGNVRFKLLEILREYGKAHIADSDDYPLLRRRKVDWYQGLLEHADAQWYGADQSWRIRRLNLEMPNIREALRFALADSPASALQMVADMRRIWVYHGMLGEGRRWLELALNAAPPEPTVHRVRAVFAIAQLAVAQGDLATVATRLTEAHSLLEVIDDPLSRGLVELIDGFSTAVSGEIERGLGCCERALAATDDIEVQVAATAIMGVLLVVGGRVEDALVWCEKAVALAEARGDSVLRSQATGAEGIGRWAHHELGTAKRLLQQCLRLSGPVNDAWTLAQILEVMAWVAETSQDAQGAVVLMAAAAAVSRAAGSTVVAYAHIGPFHAECERRAREQLTADEFEKAYRQGDSMDFDQAVTYALGLWE